MPGKLDSVFVDTNVLVYCRDASETRKQAQAANWMERLWATRAGRLSFQVQHEYYTTVTQKLSPGLETGLARQDVRNLLSWQPISADRATLEGAWALQDRYQLSWWDALIVAAAEAGACRLLLSEDLSDQRQFGTVRVIDPFKHDPGHFGY
ncbi:MAG: PIN domain-containing protein [Acidobacteria bacterium]|nr:PIN domain-containing protein [Acidobacteriota bacterium]